MISVYVRCILKQGDKMNKQNHIVDVKNPVWYPALLGPVISGARTSTENWCLDTFKT